MTWPLLPTLRPREIAVFRALQLGDMLCAVPALRALRKACPDARITLIGLPWARAFAARYARYLDDFITFPGFPGLPETTPDIAAFPAFLTAVQARRFELALQMHGNGSITNPLVTLFGAKHTAGFGPATGEDDDAHMPYPEDGSEIHRLLGLTSFLGAPAVGDALEFPLMDSDRAELEESGFATGLRPGEYVCLHPGARSTAKRWPPECFAAVGEALHAHTGLPVVLTGSEAEAPLARELKRLMRAPAIEAAGPFSAGALAVLLRDARLLVCNDTGVAHIAAALRLPSVIVFSASDMSRWAPLDHNLHRSVWAPPEAGGDAGLSCVLEQARLLLGLPFPAATGTVQG